MAILFSARTMNLLVRGEANGRDVIEPNDLPVTYASRKIDEQELALEPILQAAKWRGSPPKGGRLRRIRDGRHPLRRRSRKRKETGEEVLIDEWAHQGAAR